jgi:ABC-type transport system involved in multi-copper enzyme maturation permease subunit
MSVASGSVRDRGYRRYDGAHTPDRARTWVIARRTLSLSLRPRAVKWLALLSFLPAVIASVVVVVHAKLATLDGTVAYVYDIQAKPYAALFFGFMMALAAGAGAIADDARANALPFYFARPITRDQYLTGKLIPLAALVGLGTIAPPLVVAGVRISLAAGAHEIAGAVIVAGKALALGLLEVALFALPQLACSALTRSRGAAQLAFATLFFLPSTLGAIFSHMARSPWPSLLSMPALVSAIGRAIYGLAPEDQALPPIAALAMIAAIAVGSLAITRRSLAAAEAVPS